jgi:bifunctional non-homologous end joining protein LigD
MMAAMPLPDDLPPMLAQIGQPFDSPAHLFEVKWDGVRVLAFIEGGQYRLHSRHRRDLRERYPELEFLSRLPDGTLLDGELVVLRPDGRPDFPAMLGRENARAAARIQKAARTSPVTYVVFDLLYAEGRSLLEESFAARRARLADLVTGTAAPRLLLSTGIEGAGLHLFEAVRKQGLEGIVAKRLDSTYRPGVRSDAWLKIKPVQVLHCAILGYEPDGARDFKSLILAADVDGELRCVGKVGTGFTVAMKARLRALLFARPARAPLIDAGMKGAWIAPGLYCAVSYLERTANGSLRAPVFLELCSSS